MATEPWFETRNFAEPVIGRRFAPTRWLLTMRPVPGRGTHVQSARSSRGRPCYRRDLCDCRGRLHAAVADLADHQFRPGRIRHAAGVPDAGGDAGRRAVLACDP